LLDREGLEARFRQAGVDLSRPVIASCGSGVTACTILLALDLLGHQNHALYDGSWTEWGGQADTDVEP
jgi:thiosulfate/3-mercaptopyruvate sulfurtransferase